MENNPDNPHAQKNATWGFLIAAAIYACVAVGSFVGEKRLLEEQEQEQKQQIAEHAQRRASHRRETDEIQPS